VLRQFGARASPTGETSAHTKHISSAPHTTDSSAADPRSVNLPAQTHATARQARLGKGKARVLRLDAVKHDFDRHLAPHGTRLAVAQNA
jgi:hypothetical protein